MTAASLLAEVQALGVTLSVAGDRLRVDAPAGVLSDGQWSALAEHKGELLYLLAGPLPRPSWDDLAVQRWGGADGMPGIDVPADHWRWTVACWPHERWAEWRRRAGELMPPSPTVEQIRAAEWLAYRMTRIPEVQPVASVAEPGPAAPIPPPPEADPAAEWLIGFLGRGPRLASSAIGSARVDKIAGEALRSAAARMGVVVTGEGELETWGLPPAWVVPPPFLEAPRHRGEFWARDCISLMLEQALRMCLTVRDRRLPSAPPWCAVLGLPWPHNAADAKTAYRRLAKATHPDRGGDVAEFVRIESAYQAAVAYFSEAS